MKQKPNIKGEITKDNQNYKSDDLKDLPSLFPQEGDLDMTVCGVKQNRVKYDKFPGRLPTMDEMPYPPDEHKMIGQYEYPHNTYLILAHAFNKAMQRIDDLEKEVKLLQKE